MNGGYGIDTGFLYIPFLFYFPLTIILSIFNLRKQIENDLEKIQVKFVVAGIIISTAISFITNAVLPILGNSRYVSFGAYFIVFFLILTFYAILKHHLFNIKVIATELFTMALWIVFLINVFSSSSFNDLAINIGILVGFIFFGALLIRSVLKEVRQKEQMEKMAKDVERAYEQEKRAKETIDAIRVEDEALLSNIGDGVIAVDEAGKISFINNAAEHMLMIKAKDVVNKLYAEVLTVQDEKGETTSQFYDRFNKALSLGEKSTVDLSSKTEVIPYYVRSDGTKFPVAATVTPVVLAGKIIGAVDVFRDITIEKEIDKSKSEFVSLASHQLRTPLSAVKWYSEILLKQKLGKLTSKQKKYLNEINRGNERLISLVNTMLNLSRLEAGKLKINPSDVDVKKLFQDIIKEQKQDIQEKKQKMVCECQDGLPLLKTDLDLLRTVLQNLVSNAIKYSNKGGDIVCKTEKTGNNILMQVKDSGIGIPKEQQSKIFGKLFRASNAFAQDARGNGLGLYTAKKIIERMGGKIWFKSKEGEGTTFSIEMPIS